MQTLPWSGCAGGLGQRTLGCWARCCRLERPRESPWTRRSCTGEGRLASRCGSGSDVHALLARSAGAALSLRAWLDRVQLALYSKIWVPGTLAPWALTPLIVLLFSVAATLCLGCSGRLWRKRYWELEGKVVKPGRLDSQAREARALDRRRAMSALAGVRPVSAAGCGQVLGHGNVCRPRGC